MLNFAQKSLIAKNVSKYDEKAIVKVLPLMAAKRRNDVVHNDDVGFSSCLATGPR
jgi:hypothetical protein